MSGSGLAGRGRCFGGAPLTNRSISGRSALFPEKFRRHGYSDARGVNDSSVSRFSTSPSAAPLEVSAKNGVQNAGPQAGADTSGAICSRVGRFWVDRRSGNSDFGCNPGRANETSASFFPPSPPAVLWGVSAKNGVQVGRPGPTLRTQSAQESADFGPAGGFSLPENEREPEFRIAGFLRRFVSGRAQAAPGRRIFRRRRRLFSRGGWAASGVRNAGSRRRCGGDLIRSRPIWGRPAYLQFTPKKAGGPEI